MNRADLQRLQAHVRERIGELVAAREERGDGIADAHSATSPPAMADMELELRIAAKEKQELARLQANLQWLASEEGGHCMQCGRDIPVERLHAVPATRLCVSCASVGA